MIFKENEVLMRDELKYTQKIKKNIKSLIQKKLMIDICDQVIKEEMFDVKEENINGNILIDVSLVVVKKEQWDKYQEFMKSFKGMEYLNAAGEIVELQDFFETKEEPEEEVEDEQEN